ncbi:unnamed protein product [Fraxinus pennsylvanica]|uniref:Transcription factor CBF/NF-Y/archaeal histone domain-containing protein n=1 Tax=Fraxinus pennsylvanica TaxID=56036 RepID=A0AAD1Z4R0_9LAMI|nr:unnamed protein product [Fraxinus pennsylvanica]
MADNPEASASYDIKEQDRLLPIANVGRIMKQILPQNAKISKEAKETMQECASEFIGFVTGEASDKCRRERRKTINGDDVCWALETLGFDDYAGPMKRLCNSLYVTDEFSAILEGSVHCEFAEIDKFTKVSLHAIQEYLNSKNFGACTLDGDEIKNSAEKEIQRHADDELMMVDYALASGGRMVVTHSEPY